MDEPKPIPSETPDEPQPPARQEETAAQGSPFGSTPVEIAPVDVPAAEPFPAPPEYDVAAPPADALPGDAAPTPLIPLNEPVAIRRPVASAPQVTMEAAVPTAPPPRTGSFTLWMLIWVVAWGGIMALTLRCPTNLQFDRSTSMYAIAARNLSHIGLWPIHGGMYLTAGNVHDNVYGGRPPLTAWILSGWMKLAGEHEMAIRALPVLFTALNLLLLYTLVRRVFGAPAALAAAVITSLMPMTAYYARVVSPEPFELTFLLGAALGYLGWARSGSKFGFVMLCLCVILGCWTDWPMYAFSGFLAVAHFLRRRDLLARLPAAPDAEGDEDLTPARPLVASLFLIILPMAMFALFLVYLKMNNAGFADLKGRAVEHVAEHDGGGAAARAWFDTIKHPGQLQSWFIDLFTAPALVLAVLGMIFWNKWSRRLSLASGEAARRAAFRILLSLVLMQLTYTLAFPHAAQTRESWQYYLIVPVAVLAASLCVWLTLAGGTGRRFACGLLDRAAWSVAALIPLLAMRPFVDRVHGSVPVVPAVTLPSTQASERAAVTTLPASTLPSTKPAP
jgi:hypothetical protein